MEPARELNNAHLLVFLVLVHSLPLSKELIVAKMLVKNKTFMEQTVLSNIMPVALYCLVSETTFTEAK